MSGLTSRSTWPRLDMAARQTTNLLTLLSFGQLLNLAKHFLQDIERRGTQREREENTHEGLVRNNKQSARHT